MIFHYLFTFWKLHVHFHILDTSGGDFLSNIFGFFSLFRAPWMAPLHLGIGFFTVGVRFIEPDPLISGAINRAPTFGNWIFRFVSGAMNGAPTFGNWIFRCRGLDLSNPKRLYWTWINSWVWGRRRHRRIFCASSGGRFRLISLIKRGYLLRRVSSALL